MAKHADLTVTSDALDRAKRTLWQSFGVDALALIGVGLAAMIAAPDADPLSPVFWLAVGGLVVRSVVTALASYLARLKVAPAGAAEQDTPPAG